MSFKYKKGFSFIELSIVTVILSILFSIAYISYGRYIRQSRQIEAKSHLALAYQAQSSYLAEYSKLSHSLKTIGAVPKGQIRYNIGAPFRSSLVDDPYSETPQNSTKEGFDEEVLVNEDPNKSLCPCGNEKPADKNCWAHPQPEFQDDISHCNTGNKCFGPVEKGGMKSQLDSLNLLAALKKLGILHFNFGDIAIRQHSFIYFAIGCTLSTKEYLKPEKLDVWSIDHRKNLINLQSGI